jgi:glyoxylase-like metal-dependent hydrolase (beta-lactamase superfamily II)
LTGDAYEIDLLIQGYPGKSATHGGLGWGGVNLLRGEGRTALLDVGSFGQRRLVVGELAKRGLDPSAVTDVIVTHAHHDHATNWTMFTNARVCIGALELEWAVREPPGTPVPELYVRELERSPRLRLVHDGDEVIPGLVAHDAPGHTPGHLVYALSGGPRDILFTGDAAKNRAELLGREAEMTHDAALSRRSIERIWDMWRLRSGTLLVPGHDVPMTLDEGDPVYVGERGASIAAWFGDDLATTTLFDLT